MNPLSFAMTEEKAHRRIMLLNNPPGSHGFLGELHELQSQVRTSIKL